MATGGYGPGDPGQPAYPPGYNQPYKREVRFEAINEAWNLFRQEMGTWVITMLFALGIVAGVYFGIGLILMLILTTGGSAGRTGAGAVFGAAFLFGWLVTMLAVVIVGSYLYCGLIYMAMKQLRGEPIAFTDLFGASYAVPSAIAAGLMVGIASGLASYCFVIPGLIVGGLFMLTMPLVVDARYSAIDAMKASWNALKQDWIRAACFYFVIQLVGIAGALACGVGVLFTMPIVFLATAIVYRDFFLVQPSGYPATATMPPAAPGYAPPAQSGQQPTLPPTTLQTPPQAPPPDSPESPGSQTLPEGPLPPPTSPPQ